MGSCARALFGAWAVVLVVLQMSKGINVTVNSSRLRLRQAGAVNVTVPHVNSSRLEKVLENIIAFWDERCLDNHNGGYIIGHNHKGERKKHVTKMIVTQSRMVWFYSRLAREGYGRTEHLVAAELGYNFLKTKMWDPVNGGFLWEVDITGDTKLETRKHLYGQAFALFAISEYASASKRIEVADFAAEVFNLIDEKCHDETFGGYLEAFDEKWDPLPDNDTSLIGIKSRLKSMNTHLHMLEALTVFYRISGIPLVRARLLELITIQSNVVVRGPGACTEAQERDWAPVLDEEIARVSYGHDLENIALLIKACTAAGVSNYPLLDFYKKSFEYALTFGYDEVNGGFFDSGPLGEISDRTTKVWWVQAEALVSALYMHRLTGMEKYLGVFEKTYGFIEASLVDWVHGEWHAVGGENQGDKAGDWKAGYHNGRAMIECIGLLLDIEGVNAKYVGNGG